MTRSRWLDLALFALIAAMMVLASPRLRVYYSVTVIDVSLFRLMPDGQRQPLATPERFERFQGGYTPVEDVVPQIERAVDRYMQALPAGAEPPGTRYEWVIEYAADSPVLDRRHVVVREVPHVSR